MAKKIKVSAHLRQQLEVPAKHTHLVGHRITVEGLYLAKPNLRDGNGAAERSRVPYREEFELEAGEHKVHGQGALGHILSDKVLADRLSKKDPNFRAIITHVVSKHENIFAADDEVKPAAK